MPKLEWPDPKPELLRNMRVARPVFLLLGLGVVALVVWAIFGSGGPRVAKHEGIFTKPLTSSPEPGVLPPEASTVPPEDPDRPLDANADEEKRMLLARKKGEAERLADLQGKVPAPQKKPKTALYYRVTVRDGATLEAGGMVITLDGILAHKADAMCVDDAGKKRPCAAAARAALTRFIRARAVSCASGGKTKESFTARCSVGGTDLSTWMVRHGWAKPKEPAEPALADAAKAAQSERLGLWRATE